MRHQSCEDVHAFCKLFAVDPFIGDVSLVDGAGAADDGGDAGLLELPGFGGVGDGGEGIVSGQCTHQYFCGAFQIDIQRRGICQPAHMHAAVWKACADALVNGLNGFMERGEDSLWIIACLLYTSPSPRD